MVDVAGKHFEPLWRLVYASKLVSDRRSRLQKLLRFMAARKERYELASSLSMVKNAHFDTLVADVGSKRAIGRIGNELGDFTLGLVAE